MINDGRHRRGCLSIRSGVDAIIVSRFVTSLKAAHRTALFLKPQHQGEVLLTRHPSVLLNDYKNCAVLYFFSYDVSSLHVPKTISLST